MAFVTNGVTVTPFVTKAMSGERIDLPPAILPEGEWSCVAFTVPELQGDQAHDVGWRITLDPADPPWAFGKVYIDDIRVAGTMDYTIDMSIQRMEFGEPTPFSSNDGEADIADGTLRFRTKADGQAFTGNYYARTAAVEADVTPVAGASAGLLLRGQGCRRYYELGFSGENRVSVARRENGSRTELASAVFPWSSGKTYRLGAKAEGDRLSLSVDGKTVLEARDGRFAYGMVGVCHASGGESRWSGFHIHADTIE